MSREQNAGKNHNIRPSNKSSENVAKFIYLGTTLTNQNFTHEKTNSRLNSANACYHSVHNLLSSSLLSKNMKIKIYTTINLPVVLHTCQRWSLTLKDKNRLFVFGNIVLRKIFGPKRDK
jgi:hypothetical protein